jgi:hypothetical protein
MAMRISCFPRFFNFVALFARAAKKHTDIPNVYTRQTDICADMEIARQIQTVIPANR